MIHGRKHWRSCRHGRWCRCGSPRLHGSPMEEREAHNLVSSPYRLDLLEQLILAHNQVEVVSFPVFSIKTHSPQTVGLTRRLAKSLAIRDPRISRNSPPPKPCPHLPSRTRFSAPSLMLSTPGTGPCSSFRDMAPAVRQSTCMCICRAATCSKTPPITSVTGLNSCGGATWALSLFHALVNRGLRRTRKWLGLLEAVIPRGEQRDAKIATLSSHRESIVEGQLKFRGRLGRVPISQPILSTYHNPSLQAPITPKARWLCRVTPINDNHVGRPPSSRPPLHKPSLASRVAV
jgi:hypothetical protein